MKRFRAYAIFSASKSLGEVEAETADEAKEKAWDLGVHAYLCHACSREIELGDCGEIQVDEMGESDGNQR